MIEILNRQRKVPIPNDIRIFADSAIELVKTGERSVAIVFVSDARMKRLNAEFRDRNKTTDVLSFPFDENEFGGENSHLGDIVISAEQAARQAVQNGLSLKTELKQLVLHGLLHLSGYDHETDRGQMNKLELKLRKKLEIQG